MDSRLPRLRRGGVVVASQKRTNQAGASLAYAATARGAAGGSTNLDRFIRPCRPMTGLRLIWLRFGGGVSLGISLGAKTLDSISSFYEDFIIA